MTVINWQLLRHPMNWVTIVLMVIIGAALLRFAGRALRAGSETATQ